MVRQVGNLLKTSNNLKSRDQGIPRGKCEASVCIHIHMEACPKEASYDVFGTGESVKLERPTDRNVHIICGKASCHRFLSF